MISGENGPVFVVALTGGIASGKTTVSDQFEVLGVPVIDTDVIAHELVEPGQPLLSSVVSAFGKELLDAYGRLRRRRLRNIIFSDPDKRRQLEALMHPKIAEEALRRISRVDTPYCILVIPLLAETGGNKGADRVLVIDTPTELQIQRLTARDDVVLADAEAALAAQVQREDRLRIADDVIDNSGDRAGLEAQVLELHRKYLHLAETKRAALTRSAPAR